MAINLRIEFHLMLGAFKDGGEKTRTNRRSNLDCIERDLRRMGFKDIKAKNLKMKHRSAILGKWKEDEETGNRSPGTLANYISTWNWLMEKLGKHNMTIEREKEGFAARPRVTNKDKSIQITPEKVASLPTELMRAAVQSVEIFGLRFTESYCWHPHEADKGTYLDLVGRRDRTKNSRDRQIMLTRPEMREHLDYCKTLVSPGQSLIPVEFSLKEYRDYVQNNRRKAKLQGLHGGRHGWAQREYHLWTTRLAEERGLTSRPHGWACPCAGGPKRSELTKEERVIDKIVRDKIIAPALGHGSGRNRHDDVTSVYLGR